jgi:uncharacterized protein
MFQRHHYQIVKQRIEEERLFIQVLIGPRQIGKTTLISQILENYTLPYHFISADAVAAGDTTWIEKQWEISRLKSATENASEFLLVLDEIQKIENWSEMVKKLWDEDTLKKRNIKVILLGSSRLLLQKGLTESLAGRFEEIYMGHWSFYEMEAAFGWSVDQYIWFGGYPGSVSLIHDEDRWKNYITNSLIETSISKDILMLTRVDKPALMKRLFELGCLYSGQILSYTKIMVQLLDAGNTTTLSHYLSLLDTAGLLAGLEKYSKDSIRKRSSSPKFQVHNTALISAQKNERFEEMVKLPDQWGRNVESSIGAHLMNHALMEGFKLYYWRDGNDEVDFVLERKGKVIGIEVKSGNTQRASGMAAFKNKFNPDKILLIGTDGLPYEQFLKINPTELF